MKNLFALRDFSLKNTSDEPLALATSCWLMVDINTIRPKRIEDFRTDLKFPNAPHAIEELPDKIFLPAHMYPVFEKDIMISDLDTNHHTNNTQYVKWICDCFSENKYLYNSISSMQINFLSETLLHDKIKVLISSKNDKDNEFFISGKNLTKGTINFHSKVLWK